MAAGGVVADRAANRSSVGAGRIRAQHQAEGVQGAVEYADGDACLYCGSAGFLIDCQDAIHVLGRVDDQPGAHALTCQRTAATARQQGHAMACRKLDCGLNIVCGAGNNHAQRLDLILAGVGAVKHAAVAIETHLALDNLLQFMDQFPGLLQWFGKGSGGQCGWAWRR